MAYAWVVATQSEDLGDGDHAYSVDPVCGACECAVTKNVSTLRNHHARTMMPIRYDRAHPRTIAVL